LQIIALPALRQASTSGRGARHLRRAKKNRIGYAMRLECVIERCKQRSNQFAATNSAKR
jgi:hypothetical protein